MVTKSAIMKLIETEVVWKAPKGKKDVPELTGVVIAANIHCSFLNFRGTDGQCQVFLPTLYEYHT